MGPGDKAGISPAYYAYRLNHVKLSSRELDHTSPCIVGKLNRDIGGLDHYISGLNCDIGGVDCDISGFDRDISGLNLTPVDWITMLVDLVMAKCPRYASS